MGSDYSKQNAVTLEPTTVAVHTTAVHTTVVHTTVANIKDSELTCWIDKPEILFVSLAFFSGILSAVVVFAIIYLIRKRRQRSHQNTQEQASSQTGPEEPAKNDQNEFAYTTLVFRRAPMAV